jgi:hypothetical protein
VLTHFAAGELDRSATRGAQRMGCDIHAVIEYRHPNGFFAALTKGGLLLWRDSELFAALAGVREPEMPPLFKPRGLPPEISDEVNRLYFERQWVEDRWCVTPDPDWHSAGWLTAPEVRQALSHAGLSLDRCCWDFRAVLAAMDELDRHLGSGASRLVFWFDN